MLCKIGFYYFSLVTDTNIILIFTMIFDKMTYLKIKKFFYLMINIR